MSSPQDYFISAAQDFLRIKTDTRLNAQQMEQLLTDVLQKGKEYKEKYEAECDKRKLVENALLQFRSVIEKRSEENSSLNIQLTECKTQYKEKERELHEKNLSIQWKFNELKRKLRAIVGADERDDDENCNNTNEINNWINERHGIREFHSA